jgi:hypothetical protein
MEIITEEMYSEMNATQIAQFETQNKVVGQLVENENGDIICHVIKGEEELYYLFKSQSTLYELLTTMGFTTEIDITYMDDSYIKHDNEGSSYYNVSVNEYLHSKIRELPLSQFNIL